MVTKKPDIVADEHLTYLNDLQEAWIVEMDLAGPYLEREFGLTKAEAKQVLTYWIEPYLEYWAPSTVGEGKDEDESNRVTYYLMGTRLSGNVARVIGHHEYAYLDLNTGEWVEHASVCDSVTGYGGDADTHEISLAEAQTFISWRAPDIEPEWL